MVAIIFIFEMNKKWYFVKIRPSKKKKKKKKKKKNRKLNKNKWLCGRWGFLD